MAIVIIDANVLVGLLDEGDKWHDAAVSIRDASDGAACVQRVDPECCTGGGVDVYRVGPLAQGCEE